MVLTTALLLALPQSVPARRRHTDRDQDDHRRRPPTHQQHDPQQNTQPRTYPQNDYIPLSNSGTAERLVLEAQKGLQNRVYQEMLNYPGYSSDHVDYIRRGCFLDKNPLRSEYPNIFERLRGQPGFNQAMKTGTIERQFRNAETAMRELDTTLSQVYGRLAQGLASELRLDALSLPYNELQDKMLSATLRYTSLSDWNTIHRKESDAREAMRNLGSSISSVVSRQGNQDNVSGRHGGQQSGSQVWKQLNECASSPQEFNEVMDSLVFYHLEKNKLFNQLFGQ